MSWTIRFYSFVSCLDENITSSLLLCQISLDAVTLLNYRIVVKSCILCYLCVVVCCDLCGCGCVFIFYFFVFVFVVVFVALTAGFWTMMYVILAALSAGFGALLCNHMGSLPSRLIYLLFRFLSNESVLLV